MNIFKFLLNRQEMVNSIELNGFQLKVGDKIYAKVVGVGATEVKIIGFNKESILVELLNGEVSGHRVFLTKEEMKTVIKKKEGIKYENITLYVGDEISFSYGFSTMSGKIISVQPNVLVELTKNDWPYKKGARFILEIDLLKICYKVTKIS